MQSHRILSRAVAAAGVTGIAVVLTLTGCSSGSVASSSSPTSSAEVNPSGDIPDNQAYVSFTSPSGKFTASVPEGWARSTSGNSITFAEKLNSARFEQKKVSSAPTRDSVTTNLVPALKSSHPGFALTDIAPFTRQGGSGVLVRYQQDAPANAVTASTRRQAVQDYIFWKGGVEVDVILTSPVGADNVDPWKKITNSFSWR